MIILEKVMIGATLATLVSVFFYLLGIWLGPTVKYTKEKVLPYVGGELYRPEKILVFVHHFQYIILFVTFEMSVLVLAFAFHPAVLPSVVIYSMFLLLLLIIILI